MFRDLFRNRIEFQERPAWYQIDGFLTNIGKGIAELELDITDAIQLGGTAAYARGLETFGNQAVTNFRGTEDVDVATFNQGNFKFLLDHLQDGGEIERYTKRNSHFADKSVFDVTLPKGNQVGVNNTIAVDVYSGHGEIKFNSRRLRPDRIVFDPPEQLWSLSRTKGVVVTPSLRDMFMLKTDVVDTSGVGLRDKDEMDLLWILSIAERTDQDFMGFIHDMIQNDQQRYPRYQGTSKKLGALQSILEVAASNIIRNPNTQASAERILSQLRDLRKTNRL